MARLLGIINGTTGDISAGSYDQTMRNSFCSQMFELASSDFIANRYVRGPFVEGSSTYFRARQIADWVRSEVARRRDSELKIYLAGYSRGAWGVTYAAEMLQPEGIAVQAIFLFDPVRMQGYTGGQVVPKNVRNVYIARRKLYDRTMAKYDWSEYHGSMNPDRSWWGHTSLNLNNIDGEEKSFVGSHGALGGVGWQGISEDKNCQPQVADFMNSALIKEKLSLRISSRDFPSKFLELKARYQAMKARLINTYQQGRAELSRLYDLW